MVLRCMLRIGHATVDVSVSDIFAARSNEKSTSFRLQHYKRIRPPCICELHSRLIAFGIGNGNSNGLFIQRPYSSNPSSWYRNRSLPHSILSVWFSLLCTLSCSLIIITTHCALWMDWTNWIRNWVNDMDDYTTRMGWDEDEPERNRCNIWWPDMGIKIENRVLFV